MSRGRGWEVRNVMNDMMKKTWKSYKAVNRCKRRKCETQKELDKLLATPGQPNGLVFFSIAFLAYPVTHLGFFWSCIYLFSSHSRIKKKTTVGHAISVGNEWRFTTWTLTITIPLTQYCQEISTFYYPFLYTLYYLYLLSLILTTYISI